MEGTIEFSLSHANSNWASDSYAYDFGTTGNDLVRVKCLKMPDGYLEVSLIGALKKWFLFREKIPPLFENKLAIVITWNKIGISLYMNGDCTRIIDPNDTSNSSDNAIQNLVNLLGHEWLTGEIAKFKPTEKKPLHEQNIHPFVFFYHRYSALDIESKMRAIEAPFYRLISSILIRSKEIQGFKDAISRLRNAATFSDTVSEIILATFLKERGACVEFRATREKEAKRTSDLFWFAGSNQAVPIECKHVHAYSGILEKASQRWPTISQMIEKKIRSRQIPCDTYFKFRQLPDQNMMIAPLNEIAKLAVGPDWAKLSENHLFEFWAKTSKKGEMKTLNVIMPPIVDWDRIYIQIKTLSNTSGISLIAPDSTHRGPAFLKAIINDPIGAIKDPIVIGLELDTPRLNIANFVNLFKSAIGQIDQNGPGIIGVHLPQPSKYELKQYAKWVENEFRKGNYSRVNRVCLFWISEAYEKHFLNDELYLNPTNKIEFRIIDNPKPIKPLEPMPNWQ